MTVDYHEGRQAYLSAGERWMLRAVVLHFVVTAAVFVALFMLLSGMDSVPVPVIGVSFMAPPVYFYLMVRPARLTRRYESTHPYSNHFTGAS